MVTHHARATATAANDAVDSLHGDASLAAGQAHVRVRRRGHARDPRPWPARFINSRQGAGAGRGLLGETCVHCIACIMHGSLASRARAACTHCSSAAGLGQSSARGWPWPRSMHMHGMDAGGSSCFACSSGRAGGLGQSSARLFGSEAFHFSSEESKGVSQTLFVRMNELA